MKKVFALMLAGAMMATSLVGCGSSNDAGSAGSVGTENQAVKLGILAPLTGDVSVYGIATNNGIQLALEEINANGGVLGQPVTCEVLDEKGDVTEATNAYNKLSSSITALIGDVTSKPCLAVADIAAEDGMPMITPTGTAQAITEIGDNVFRACFTDPFQGNIMATFAADSLGAKNVAVMYNTSDDYSQGVANGFIETAEAKGITITANEGYGNDDKDFNTQLTKIIATNPDAIFVPDYYQKVALIATQARAAGYTAPLLGADGWDGVLTVLDDAKKNVVDNCYFSNHYSTTDTDEKVQDFLKNYQEKYNDVPNAFAALGYDAAYIMCNAIEKAGTTDKAAIIEALSATDYTGVTGQMTFDEVGNPIKTVSVTKLMNGEATLDSKVSAQ